MEYDLAAYVEGVSLIRHYDVRAARGEAGKPPAPAVDALLKAGLLASQLLVSPNNLREVRELSLAYLCV